MKRKIVNVAISIDTPIRVITGMDAGKDAAMAFGRGEGINKMRCYAMRVWWRGDIL